MNGLTRAGGKQFASNAGRKPDRYTGIIWMDEIEVDIKGYQTGWYRRSLTTLLSQ